jgi:hypothetical protein
MEEKKDQGKGEGPIAIREAEELAGGDDQISIGPGGSGPSRGEERIAIDEKTVPDLEASAVPSAPPAEAKPEPVPEEPARKAEARPRRPGSSRSLPGLGLAGSLFGKRGQS